MSTKAITTEYRMAQWAGIIRERGRSGESIREFCLNRGISKNTYFYWQKKLREVAGRELGPAIEEKGLPTVVPGGWAMCEVRELDDNASAVTIAIGKFRITTDAGTSPEQLEKVCRVLMRLC